MPITLQAILYLFAIICFFLGTIGVGGKRVNVTPLGLLFWLLATVVKI